MGNLGGVLSEDFENTFVVVAHQANDTLTGQHVFHLQRSQGLQQCAITQMLEAVEPKPAIRLFFRSHEVSVDSKAVLSKSVSRDGFGRLRQTRDVEVTPGKECMRTYPVSLDIVQFLDDGLDLALSCVGDEDTCLFDVQVQ